MSQYRNLGRNSKRVLPGVSRRQFIKYGSLTLGTGLITACSGDQSVLEAEPTGDGKTAQGSETRRDGGLTPVSFGTNWYAQAEQGGFYQAVATGIYEAYGLDVTIKMGGPQVNGTQLLMGDAVDFFMGYASDAIKAVEAGIPKITVAAIFQKDPQILIAHPKQGINSLADLKGRPIFISQAANVTYWPFLAAKYGFTEDMKRNYNYSVAPFLADVASAQQGYLSSEPLMIKEEGGFDPIVFLMADFGYTPYAATIETKQALVESDPDLVQRFVDASIRGWYSYFENPEPGNALIKQANPEMTDEQIAYSIEKMQEFGIVLSGESKTQGIGAMTDDRWKSFFDTLVGASVFKPDTDYTQAYTLAFVNKGTDYYTK
ncbi:MAG: ABC transporter substrate-binding protein [Leptolyngbyaceae cyanobacterium MO_188.B28]|nr:ABC transporter substrate-binding protein [Leptolyngbyaceae cyanobacterium MO_188.B28]